MGSTDAWGRIDVANKNNVILTTSSTNEGTYWDGASWTHLPSGSSGRQSVWMELFGAVGLNLQLYRLDRSNSAVEPAGRTKADNMSVGSRGHIVPQS